jgi:hypothetical protein
LDFLDPEWVKTADIDDNVKNEAKNREFVIKILHTILNQILINVISKKNILNIA